MRISKLKALKTHAEVENIKLMFENSDLKSEIQELKNIISQLQKEVTYEREQREQVYKLVKDFDNRVCCNSLSINVIKTNLKKVRHTLER